MTNNPRLPLNFRYNRKQAVAILQTLQNAGLQEKNDWPQYKTRITEIVHKALAIANAPPLPYANQVAKQLDRLKKRLDDAAKCYSALTLEIQRRIDESVPSATLIHPLLMASLLPEERPIAERLLEPDMFLLALNIVSSATSLAAEPLRNAGKPAVVSQDLLSLLPLNVVETVKNHAAFPRKDRLYQATGAPKDYAIRYAVQALRLLYEEATGKRPTVYPTEHRGKGVPKKEKEKNVRYAGEFCEFAVAALTPVRLAPPTVLASRIHAATSEVRDALKRRK